MAGALAAMAIGLPAGGFGLRHAPVATIHPNAHAQGDPAAAIDACMRAEMADRGVHGAQIAVAEGGVVVLERAYGHTHRDRPDAVDVDTRFRIGSTTKALTAFAILQQVDAGAIELDAPMTTYLDGFRLAEPGQAEAITVRDLLRHTSGLHDNSAMDEDDLFGPTDPGALARWVAEQNGTRPYAPPGRFWNYSSANYMYAGRILERVAGVSYQDYMDARVFGPARMVRTTMHARQAVAEGNFAYGHFPNPFSGRLEIYALHQADNWARHPTGYANATAGDLVRFAALLIDGGRDVLSQSSALEMQSRQQHRDLRPDQHYGLGTFVEYHRGREMVHHDGGAWGWSATLKWVPEVDVAVATVSNTYGGILHDATECALRAFVLDVPVTPEPCRLDRGRWQDFVGTYTGSANTGTAWTFHVTRTAPNGNLRMRVERDGGLASEHELTQDCTLWLERGEGTFDASGIGPITFIDDPVEPDWTWLRHRFFVGGRRRPDAPEPSSTPTDGATAPTPTAVDRPTRSPSSTPTRPVDPPHAVHVPLVRRGPVR